MAFTPVFDKSKMISISSDYHVEEQLGSGTYSVVYKGKRKTPDPGTNPENHSVAIKVMQKSADEEELWALRGEVMIMQKLKDADHVVRLLDVYETNKEIMLVLDLVTGGELFEKIVARGVYSEKDASFALKQMMTALSQMHSLRIIHRDLKPENILCVHKDLDRPEDIKIADFGESIQLKPGETTNELRGSPCYIAPEVWLQENYDMASDMWSMGVIAFILLGGYLPFEAPPPEGDEEPDELRISEVVIRGDFYFHPDVWGDTSANAKDFVSKLLNTKQKERLTAAQALLHPFLCVEEASTASRNKAMANLKSFNAKRKWQSVAQVVIATNRMKMLSGLTSKSKRKSKKVSSTTKSKK